MEEEEEGVGLVAFTVSAPVVNTSPFGMPVWAISVIVARGVIDYERFTSALLSSQR